MITKDIIDRGRGPHRELTADQPARLMLMTLVTIVMPNNLDLSI